MLANLGNVNIASFKKRYFYKLSSNLVGFLIGLVTAMIVPRSLGPGMYGNFTFLTNFFQQVVNFLEMGTSTAFYVKLSQRRDEKGLVGFYLIFSFLICLSLFAFVICCQATSTFASVFKDQQLFYGYLACFWAVLTWIVLVLQRMVDAQGLTVSAEISKIIQRALGLVAVLILFFWHRLNLTTLFIYHFFILIFLIIAFICILSRAGYNLHKKLWMKGSEFKRYIREFYAYSHPLFVTSAAAMAVGIGDRWILQYFGGSVQQGYFGLSFRIVGVCALFSTAMMPLITRDYAIAFEKGDIEEMGRLFRRFEPILYFVVAYIACFTAVQADKIVRLFGGGGFTGAANVMIIMAFYPVNQTLGQLVSSFFFATGQTALYRNISIIFLILGLPITYFFLASEDKMGLNLGATGLAIKTVGLQLISVNVRLIFNARALKLRLWKYMLHQILVMGLFVALAYGSRGFVCWIFGNQGSVFTTLTCSGIVYTFFTAVLLLVIPSFVGFSRTEMQRTLKSALSFSSQLIARQRSKREKLYE